MDLRINDIFEDDLHILDIIDHGFPRLRYTRSDYFHEMDEFNFYKRLRLTKQTVLQVLIQIEERLEFHNDVNNSVSPMNQLLVTLRFYASSGHLVSIADFGGMHTSTVLRIIVRVSAALAGLSPQHIKIPETLEEIQQVQNDFFTVASFPRVIGAIDCTRVKIQSPGGNDAEVFRNRKGYFSLNVQVISDARLHILDLVARWSGSAHDAIIFNSSRIRARVENGEFQNSFLLGDSGYPQRPYLLTPLPNTVTRAKNLYNESHIRTQNTVERLFGNWKRRFPVLAYGMRLKMSTIMCVICATGVLQNIAREMNEMQPPLPGEINVNELEALIGQGNNVVAQNENDNTVIVRDVLMNDYCNNL